jgi:Bacterial regulatory protein, arsR family
VAGPSLRDREAVELERLLRSVADRHRLKILNMLVRAGAPVCVCEFTAELELPQQNISYHLKQLVDAGVPPDISLAKQVTETAVVLALELLGFAFLGAPIGGSSGRKTGCFRSSRGRVTGAVARGCRERSRTIAPTRAGAGFGQRSVSPASGRGMSVKIVVPRSRGRNPMRPPIRCVSSRAM